MCHLAHDPVLGQPLTRSKLISIELAYTWSLIAKTRTTFVLAQLSSAIGSLRQKTKQCHKRQSNCLTKVTLRVCEILRATVQALAEKPSKAHRRADGVPASGDPSVKWPELKTEVVQQDDGETVDAETPTPSQLSPTSRKENTKKRKNVTPGDDDYTSHLKKKVATGGEQQVTFTGASPAVSTSAPPIAPRRSIRIPAKASTSHKTSFNSVASSARTSTTKQTETHTPTNPSTT